MAEVKAKEVARLLYDASGKTDSHEPEFWRGKSAGLYEAAALVRDELCETEEQSRQRFEAWIKSTSTATWPHSFDRRGGKYVNDWYQSRWEAWQASQTFREASE